MTWYLAENKSQVFERLNNSNSTGRASGRHRVITLTYDQLTELTAAWKISSLHMYVLLENLVEIVLDGLEFGTRERYCLYYYLVMLLSWGRFQMMGKYF